MKILVIGGTRNLGYYLVKKLLSQGHQITILNRGKTRDELPDSVERLRADRADSAQLAAALAGREFDVVVDNALYDGDEAETIIKLLSGKVGHYIFLSTGQVYLVREAIERPYAEADYAGRLLAPPKPTTFSYEEWKYGMEKRHAEDRMAAAWNESGFPFTSLRLPMVNGERDHFNRLYAYVLRLQDGGPILVPSTPNFPLRHVYAGDVVRALLKLIETGAGKGQAFNISQDELVTLEEFLNVLGNIMGREPAIAQIPRSILEANGFLPDCSPFSERWMSELDNTRSKVELGMEYTPLPTYLEQIVNYYDAHDIPNPVSYRRRRSEKMLAMQMQQEG